MSAQFLHKFVRQSQMTIPVVEDNSSSLSVNTEQNSTGTFYCERVLPGKLCSAWTSKSGLNTYNRRPFLKLAILNVAVFSGGLAFGDYQADPFSQHNL